MERSQDFVYALGGEIDLLKAYELDLLIAKGGMERRVCRAGKMVVGLERPRLCW